MDRLNILFLLEGRNTPSSRVRILNYLPHLDRSKYDWQVRPIPNSIFSRPALFRAAAQADLVVIQKKLFRGWELPFLTGRLGMIYDFDDMVMLPGRDKFDPHQPVSQARQRRFDRTLARAKVVIAGSDYLRAQTGPAQDRTVVIPTTVDTQAQPVKTVRETKQGLVLGWIGTKGNLRYLQDLAPVFQTLAGRYPGLTLKIVCDGFIDLAGVQLVKTTWRLEDEPADLVSFDLGLMPLTDDPWSRGKCGYKLLQYMAAGLPAVASPVGVNREIVRDGLNGFLAADPADWLDRLDRLLASPNLRREMGRAGRLTVEERFDLRRRAVDFAQALDAAAGVSPP